MATIESRITLLEQRLSAAAIRNRPMKFYRLPAVGDTRREAVQAEIDARTKAAREYLVYEIV